MSDADRAQLAAELKRSFQSLRPGRTPSKTVNPSPVIERSISFTAPLLAAVLAGQKTQTRRPIRPQPSRVENHSVFAMDGSIIPRTYDIGDRVWVREKWARVVEGGVERFVYASDEPLRTARWISSRFMPRAAARRFLTVKKVDVARLDAIDDSEAACEGVLDSAIVSPRLLFLGTWNAIYGETEFRSANDPWVWVIHFALESIEPQTE